MVRKQSVEHTHECLVCGKKYNLCRSCNEMKNHGLFSWRATCDTTECFQVFVVLNDFDYGKITREEARKQLDRFLSEDMKPFTLGARRSINKIYDVDDNVESFPPASQEVVPGAPAEADGSESSLTPSKDVSAAKPGLLSMFRKKS